MPVPLVLRLCLLSVLLNISFCSVLGAAAKPSISYNRDVRQILSDNCFYCHGPDASHRKAKMRLDVREEALKKEAFVPGKPDKSEVVRRIFSADPEELMPPPDSNKKLSPAQKELLKRWIAEGSTYEGHWAYQLPVRPAIPAKSNPIDYLVQQRLKSIGLVPAAEADRRTLVRRLYLDLIGVPPKPEEVDGFVQNKSLNAYPELIEKLLASPHYGERRAIAWLDVVRFADTIGYHSDTGRNIWPYRDYVIRSFNENKLFDVFTREQLAGDLLPNSTLDQKVASAFNRLLLSTEEGGAQAKDYEARMLTDRVRAIGAVWLGQTIGCAQCHDHKFDPITSHDFYSMGAFFADIKEPIIGAREPGMFVPKDQAQAEELVKWESKLTGLEAQYNGPHPELKDSFATWEREQTSAVERDRLWAALTPSSAESAEGVKLDIKSDQSILASGKKKPEKDTYAITLTNLSGVVRGLRIEALPDDSLPAKGPGRANNGNFVLTRIRAVVQHGDGTTEPVSFHSARASFEQSVAAESNPYKLWSAASVLDANAREDSTGWAILPEVARRQQLQLEIETPLEFKTGDTLKIELVQNHGHGSHTLGHFRLGATSNPEALTNKIPVSPTKEIADIAALAPEKRNQAQKDKLWDEYKKQATELMSLRQEIAGAKKSKTDFEATVPRCLVSVSEPNPRTVRILPRGNFLVETGEKVKPAFPGYLKASWQKYEKPQLTRLDLADWLIAKENPLTARVTMNRLWKEFFGAGLAKSLDDFGAQGESPKNQALLDWLSCEFMESGWDLKHMVKLLVTSRTYRQSSVMSGKALAVDPQNREFSAQGRWRLEAELVRDNALAISGLLVEKIGGPSVKPYQPDGYWENLNFPVRTWEKSMGEDQYRRGIYTWWQRSYLHPSMVAFDAPTREECVAERNRSNIPQQALALLNDPSYVEASRALAARVIQFGGKEMNTRINWAWKQALGRLPRTDEIKISRDLVGRQLAEYYSDPEAAKLVIHVGLAPNPDGIDPVELAAWTSVCRVILNLHETVTRN
ncbi:MAG: Planctomycete cytochrome [Verrucomicrobiales bacterium]|jgi:hypothetical protein|nr:Planctomycete cytochrome [Verrucomicrobiales bacterium]